MYVRLFLMLVCGNENLAANSESIFLVEIFSPNSSTRDEYQDVRRGLKNSLKVKISKNIRDKHGEKNCPIKFSLKQANIQNRHT